MIHSSKCTHFFTFFLTFFFLLGFRTALLFRGKTITEAKILNLDSTSLSTLRSVRSGSKATLLGHPSMGKQCLQSHVGQRRRQRKRPRGLPSFRRLLFTYIPTWPALLMFPLKCKQIVSTIRLLPMLFHPL